MSRLTLRASRVHSFAAAMLLALAFAMPAQDARAQDPLLGGILGGAAGAIIGGAAGGGRGAAIGAIIGGTTGAIIASEGQRRANGYYYWRNGCYMQRGDGAYVQVQPGYCGPPVAYAPPPPVYGPPPGAYGPPPPPPGYAQTEGDPIAYCMQRYRSYDPASQTFLGFDGLRHPCP
jgi:hypothetical protein